MAEKTTDRVDGAAMQNEKIQNLQGTADVTTILFFTTSNRRVGCLARLGVV